MHGRARPRDAGPPAGALTGGEVPSGCRRAVAGGTGGYLYDKSKKNEEKAYDKGVKDGQSGKTK